MSPSARLFLSSVVLLAAAVSCALATNIHVVNKCGFNTDVIYTANINERPLPSQNVGTLRPGGSLQFNPGRNVFFNVKNGYGGKTWAEFSIDPNNWPGHDSYDLSVIPGYDIAMQIIAPFGGFSPICTYSGCPDAFHYWNDYSKTHVVNTGGTFTIVFCA